MIIEVPDQKTIIDLTLLATIFQGVGEGIYSIAKMSEHAIDPRTREVFTAIIPLIENGSKFSDALASCEDMYWSSPLFLGYIRFGEEKVEGLAPAIIELRNLLDISEQLKYSMKIEARNAVLLALFAGLLEIEVDITEIFNFASIAIKDDDINTKSKFASVAGDLRTGITLANCPAIAEVFGKEIAGMWAIGEASGLLNEILFEAATWQARIVDTTIVF
ncbi:MAG: hypothetical protein NTW50_04850 [Candidatus Berkelbacteria bacterium]|nr:hypothetical protein [Candidatus Berkelbacteria bacterium]